MDACLHHVHNESMLWGESDLEGVSNQAPACANEVTEEMLPTQGSQQPPSLDLASKMQVKVIFLHQLQPFLEKISSLDFTLEHVKVTGKRSNKKWGNHHKRKEFPRYLYKEAEYLHLLERFFNEEDNYLKPPYIDGFILKFSLQNCTSSKSRISLKILQRLNVSYYKWGLNPNKGVVNFPNL